MRLPIIYYGNKILRAKCRPIEAIDQHILTLIENMIETMDASKGIGIAAPQVGQLLSVFVLRNYLEDDEGLSAPQVYINPKIINPSKDLLIETEGCLSIPEIREEVERPSSITIEAMDLQGNLFVEKVSGYNARVRMHENDHLNGVLFIDRIDSRRRKKIEPLLKKIQEKHNPSR